MKVVSTILLALVFLSAVSAAPEGASRRDERPRGEPGRVILCSGENFDGVSVELLPGATIANLGDLLFSDGRKVNDRISSVRVFGGLKVTLYSDANFGGDALELSESAPRLVRVPRRNGNWDNCLSSVRVSGGEDRRPPERDRRPREDRGRDWDDERGRPGDHGRDDERPARRSELSGAEIERIVGRAFRELLSREPNGAELRRYREAVYTEGWGRDEIYDDIRGTKEYLSRATDRLIERVYREMLDRAPTSGDLSYWRNKILNKGWSERRFRAGIRDSEEYRNHQAQRRTPDGPRH